MKVNFTQNIFNRCLEFYNGTKIPQIGYGTYQLKGNDCLKGVEYALKIGYRHIDTASIYQNSVQIGNVLKECGIPREDIFITSKISPQQQGYENTIKACEEQLANLQIQYLDCLLIHWPGVAGLKPEDSKNAIIRLETYRALEELLQKGMIKSIGVSNFLERHLIHLLQNVKTKPVMNQIEIHPLGWDKATVDFCQKNGILVEAYSPLARQDSQLMKNNLLLKLSQFYNKSIAQISLRWAYQKNFIVLPKSKRENFIQENFNIEDFELSEIDMNQIDNLNVGLKTCWNPDSVKF